MYIAVSIVIMAVVTYIIRALPLSCFSKQINSQWIKSFLYYMPYTVLTAMTIPAIFYVTSSMMLSVIGFAVAVVLAYFNRGLMLTALGSVGAMLLVQFLCK